MNLSYVFEKKEVICLLDLGCVCIDDTLRLCSDERVDLRV